MTDACVVVATVVSAIFAVAVKVANDRGYDSGFKDGVWFGRVGDRIPRETVSGAFMEDYDD